MCFKNRNRNYPTETTVSHTWSQSLLRSKMDRQFLKITEKKLEKQKNKAYLFFFFFLIAELKWTSVSLYVTSVTYKLRELLVDLRNPCRTQACPESSRQKYILEECNGCLGNCHTISIHSTGYLWKCYSSLFEVFQEVYYSWQTMMPCFYFCFVLVFTQ